MVIFIMSEPEFEEAVGREAQVVVNRVTITTPPFSSAHPALWFASLEAQFEINQVVRQTTKYHYAVAHLDTNCTKEVEDLIIDPPKENPYTALKDAIIRRFSETKEHKIRRLLEREQLGDRKPSSFLRHLKSLAGTPFPDDLLKSIWLGRLPRFLQTVLTAQSLESLTELSELADKLVDINAEPQACSIKPANPDQYEVLSKKVDDLTRAIAALTTDRGRSSNAGRRSGQGRNRDRSRSRSRPRNPDLCFYHDRFAAKAHKCVQPCKWAGTGAASEGQNPN